MTDNPSSQAQTVADTPPADDLVDYLRRASVAVYIAMEAEAAHDLSPRLKQAADIIEALRATCGELRGDFGRIADIARQHDAYMPDAVPS